MKNIDTLEELQEILKTEKPKDITCRIGQVTLGEDYENNESYKILKYMFENVLPPLKIFKWGDILKERQSGKWTGFNGLRNKSIGYHSKLHHGVSSLVMTENHAGFGFQTAEEVDLNVLDSVLAVRPSDKTNPECLENVNSSYYHSAKAHWLVQSILKEGLWAPIQGYTRAAGDKVQLEIHPGSVRSGVFEEMENEDMELMIWDTYGALESLPTASIEEALEYWKGKLELKDRHLNIAFLYTRGVIEFQTDLADLTFRKQVFDFNRKVHKLSHGKPLTIYIGYDSSMNDLEKICEESITKTIKDAHTTGQYAGYLKFTPTIKYLDISKLPDYTREYANQSTEFTYSRFLIPHLENYEGFSLFVDNDFIFTKNLLPMFYYLNPEDAIACIKYPHYEHDESKFDGEINIDYPCKLWSSMMFFNNSHEDCKKLTPEVVNTWTGKQLHQFEWTDAISEIPQKYIFVEGYDNPEEKWDYSGIHYTRGGPWIDGMDSTSINNLEVYNKYKNLYENTPK